MSTSKRSYSLSFYAWYRFKKNSLGILGAGIIIVAIFVSVSGSLIRPDGTPNANEMNLPLKTKPPGFDVQMLLVRKNKEVEKPGFFGRLFFGGTENEHRQEAITSYWFEEDEIVVKKYTGFEDEEEAPVESFNLADVVYPLLGTSVSVKREGDVLEFYTINKEKQSEAIAELQEKVVEENIKTKSYLLGTDRNGRDLLSRLMAGTIISLSIGFISVIISLCIGMILGAIAGFYRGRLDDLIMWLINVVWSIPTLILVIAITLVLGKGFWQVFVAVGITMWVDVARVVRGQVLGVREHEFVEAGKALGYKNFRIIRRHIFPNILGPIIVIAASNFAAAILIEAGLSFLGIGAQPPMVSWGGMIKDYYNYINIEGKAYLAIFPGLAIMLMVLAFYLVGNGLRDALDVKSIDNITSGTA